MSITKVNINQSLGDVELGSDSDRNQAAQLMRSETTSNEHYCNNSNSQEFLWRVIIVFVVSAAAFVVFTQLEAHLSGGNNRRLFSLTSTSTEPTWFRNDSCTFTGPRKNGLPHGVGLADCSNPHEYYCGQMVEGKRHGKGSYSDLWENRNEQWQLNERRQKVNQKLTITWQGGITYRGDFSDDQYHGKGVLTERISGAAIPADYLFCSITTVGMFADGALDRKEKVITGCMVRNVDKMVPVEWRDDSWQQAAGRTVTEKEWFMDVQRTCMNWMA